MSDLPLFPGGFMWHHDVHDVWCEEDLWLYFLAFEPTYNRRESVKQLVELLRRNEITSFAIYELTGQYDLLLRAWIPRKLKNFGKKLEDEIHDVAPVQEIATDEIVHHWVWEQTRRSQIGDMIRPKEEDLERRPPRRELELLNAYQADHMNAADNAAVAASDDDLLEQEKLIKEYKRLRLITEPLYEPGIKFVVQVKVAGPMTKGQRVFLREALETSLHQAQGVIWDRSLYHSRAYIQYLVMGRVPTDDVERELGVDMSTGEAFHAISPQLLDPINNAASLAGTRTYTFFFPLKGFLAHADQLRVPPLDEVRRPDPLSLFKQRETQDFEVKGSVFTELDRWIKGDGELRTSTDGKSSVFQSFIFGLASLLNADGGGLMLLGAVEEGRYGKYERCQAMPKVGYYRCCGLGPDLPNGDWDEFHRLLWDKIATAFSRDPTLWLTLWPADVEGQMVGILHVREPDEVVLGQGRRQA